MGGGCSYVRRPPNAGRSSPVDGSRPGSRRLGFPDPGVLARGTPGHGVDVEKVAGS
jgi:hypothetical protein